MFRALKLSSLSTKIIVLTSLTDSQLKEASYQKGIIDFEKKFKDNEIPNIYGDGEQYRDFVYVKDVAKANIKAMNTPNVSGEVFCVGTSKKVSINNLVSVLNNKYSKNIKANYLEARNGDIKESICDNKKIRQFLEFESFISFEEGILKL
jgi:UDP-glucose 4-epimerase